METSTWIVQNDVGVEYLVEIMGFLIPEYVRIFGKDKMYGESCIVYNDTEAECPMLITNLVPVRIRLGTVRSYAVSPDQEGRYTVGYYVVHIPQVIHGIPVSVIQNCGSSNSMTITTTVTSPTGFRMRVFDSGMKNVTGFWLNEQTLTPIDTYDTLLSLDGAVEVLKTWVLNNYESKPLAIREIRFEYAMVERNGQLTLVPAWSFDTLQGVPNDHFDGIQIDATNGEILRAIEEFWL